MGFDSISLIVSIASLIVGIAALLIARSSLSQAQTVANRERKDWRQRKWFDLYFQTNQVYDLLDAFQARHKDSNPTLWGSEQIEDWNRLMQMIRKLHATAMVFPKNRAIDKMIAATAAFREKSEALSEERLKRILEAMEDLRMEALVDPDVLGAEGS